MPHHQKKLAKVGRALLAMRNKGHSRPKKPTKQDLDSKFKMVVDRKGKPSIIEVD